MRQRQVMIHKSTTSTPTTGAAKRRKFSTFRLVSRVFRVGICVTALWVLYKRYNTEEVSNTVEVPQGAYEEIEVDDYRYSQVLDALKVRALLSLTVCEELT